MKPMSRAEPLITPAEQQARRDLAALYRLCAHFGMSDLIYTHLTARVPGAAEHFLINRFGVLFHEMRPEDLVKVDLDGTIVDERRDEVLRINPAGFTIHSAVHMARPDLTCVIHTHTIAGMAVSAQREGLLPLTQHAMLFWNRVGYHDYEGIALDLAERERLIADLGSHKVLILRNHGVLVGGRSIAEAFHIAYHLERACQAQVAAQAGGAALNLPPEPVRETTARIAERIPEEQHQVFWQSALRLIEPA